MLISDVLSLLLHVSTTCSNLPPTTSQYLHVYTILSFTVQDGDSPLFMASQNGHTDIVDLLLKAGADVHQVFRPVHMLLSNNIPSSMHTYYKGWWCSSDNGCSAGTLPHSSETPGGRSQYQPPGRGDEN